MALSRFLIRLNPRRFPKKHLYNLSLIENEKNSWNEQDKSKISKYVTYSLIFGAAWFGVAKIDESYKRISNKTQDALTASAEPSLDVFEAGEKREDLPTFRSEEIQKHNTPESFWVTYKEGVYDVTKFLPEHPGGKQILNAGGLSIEPFWNVYGMHKTEALYKLLESYRIGNLHKDDFAEWTDDELWAKEPARNPQLVVKNKRPFNAEVPMKMIVQSLDTPNDLFFVRSHMPVPELDAREHRLTINLKGKRTTQAVFDLKQLDKFPKAEIRAALMCAGNRRSDMNKVKEVKGIGWFGGAISNAKWSGVFLRDVLISMGVDQNDTEGKYVIFTGSDMDATGEYFNTSIPLTLAMDPNAKILLATKMNGEPLPRDHGYPLRVIVPGAAAVRSVKWLQEITVSEEQSTSHWHLQDYRGFNPSKTWETADFSTAPPIYTLPVTSAICDPTNGETVAAKNGTIEVKGYAYSGGGSKIVRVDVTPDGGKTWIEAEPMAVDSAPAKQHYSLYLWKANIPVEEKTSQIELWVKATDSNFNTQPEKFEHIWNIRGLLSNAYHKINIKIRQ